MPKTLRGGGTGGRLTQSNVRKMRRGGRGGRSCSPNQLQIIGLFCTALTGAGGDPEAPQRCNLFNFCEWHTAPHPEVEPMRSDAAHTVVEMGDAGVGAKGDRVLKYLA